MKFLIPKFDEFKHPICLLDGIYQTIKHHINTKEKVHVSGHIYKTDNVKTPPNVVIDKCKRCGHKVVGWSFGSLEHMK